MGMGMRRISILSPISRLSPTRERESGKKSGKHSRNEWTRKKPEQSIWSPMSVRNDSSTLSLTGVRQTSGPETMVDGYHCQQSGWSEAAGTRRQRRSPVSKKNQSDARCNNLPTQPYDMDTTQTTHISLCAGYGGIDLGLRGAIPNLRTVAFSEIEAFASANLVSKMEAGLLDCAPIWTDLKTFPWRAFRDRVDILSGGYPCQPFSAAGKRLGTDDPRHLWPFIADGIRILRPKLCFFENVEGHITLGLREVIGELESMGYKVSWGIFSAREVGAPHQRKRVFILAHRKCEGLERWGSAMQSAADQCWTSNNTWKSCDLLANTLCNGSGEGWLIRQGADGAESVSNGESWGAWPSRPGEPQHGWEPPRVVGNTRSKRCEQDSALRGQQQASGTSEECGLGVAEAVGDTASDGSHQRDSETRGEESGSEQGRVQELEGGSPSVGDTEYDGLPTQSILRGDETTSDSWGTEEPQQAGQLEGADRPINVPSIQGCTSGSKSMGNTETRWRRESGDETCKGQGHRSARPSRSDDQLSQTKPSMGGDSDGSADWMDYAELYVTTDNRTDELRLLGNGVVPATATRAFLILMKQLLNDHP